MKESATALRKEHKINVTPPPNIFFQISNIIIHNIFKADQIRFHVLRQVNLSLSYTRRKEKSADPFLQVESAHYIFN